MYKEETRRGNCQYYDRRCGGNRVPCWHPKMLGHLLVNAGYDVKVSEVHGMSQRGGSVVTYVRFGDKVYSPIIDKGEADFIGLL